LALHWLRRLYCIFTRDSRMLRAS